MPNCSYSYCDIRLRLVVGTDRLGLRRTFPTHTPSLRDSQVGQTVGILRVQWVESLENPGKSGSPAKADSPWHRSGRTIFLVSHETFTARNINGPREAIGWHYGN